MRRSFQPIIDTCSNEDLNEIFQEFDEGEVDANVPDRPPHHGAAATDYYLVSLGGCSAWE